MLCIKHLHGRKSESGFTTCCQLLFESSRRVLSSSVCSNVASQFLCLHRSFIMTKRDSQIAQLPSPRTLNMESHDIDMPTAGPHSYTAPAIPGPDSHPQAASSTAPATSTSPQIPPLQLPTGAYQTCPRQKVGHSIVFKILEYTSSTGRIHREVLVEDTDADGYTHPKSLEFFFNGIVGHLCDRWGGRLDSDRLCSQLANYWRSWFRSPTIGPVFEYADPEPWTNPEPASTVSTSPAPETTPATEPQLPVQVYRWHGC